ncbi:hypothetical protein ACJIZ3_003297 [Penstemon smallii]|uniref:Uncharacterized protein n=1 Tax=Penstemon smallii TaxID=265156 RepID=A0ABD3U8U6_9LAMI
MIQIVLNTLINLFNFQVQPSSSLLLHLPLIMFIREINQARICSWRPEHVLGGPKQQIAKLNPAD